MRTGFDKTEDAPLVRAKLEEWYGGSDFEVIQGWKEMGYPGVPPTYFVVARKRDHVSCIRLFGVGTGEQRRYELSVDADFYLDGREVETLAPA